MQLQPLDTLVNINPGADLFDKVSGWATGPYNHCFLYLGKWQFDLISCRFKYQASYLKYFSSSCNISLQARFIEVPLITESVGRGRLLHTLEDRFGQRVKVMRLKPEYFTPLVVHQLLMKSMELSGQYNGWYGYDDIVRFVLPRVLNEKFHIRFRLDWIPDSHPICSEHVYEILKSEFEKVLKIPRGWIPMPEDFVIHNIIQEEAGEIVLGPEVV